MSCPLCNSENTLELKKFDSEAIITEWQRQYRLDIRPQFHGHRAFELRACRECSLQFFVPRELTGSSTLYTQLEDFDWYYQSKKWEYEVALEDLRQCKKVLEVGCGSGNFMVLAKQNPGLDIEGLEQNPRAIAEAKGRGLSVSRSTLEEVGESFSGNYDAVCSFQVLEHVPDPANFVRVCCALLRPGGKLLLGVPNAESFLRHQFNLLDMPPHHISRWSVMVLSALPKLFPLGSPHVKLEPLAEYHIEGYVDAYTGLLGRGPFSLLTHPGVKSRVTWLVRRLALHHLLRGQTLYACYERN
jgi:2-polyprenyl-3-methyl-5-hydroxy-6-metoxy-1,4-benzoquinol methylase